jgi:hypothetical protein
MHLFLTVLLLLTFQVAGPNRIRLLLRDQFDTGIAGATLTLRTADTQMLQLVTDANGVAVSAALPGDAVWLMGGRLANGQALSADSYPKDAGFRLALIRGQTRDALLRLDGDRLVLDPDMIFSPGEPGEVAPPTPAALAATVPPLHAAPPVATVAPVAANAHIAATEPAPSAEESTALRVLWWVGGVGLVLVVLAFLIGLARRRIS